MKRLQPWIRLGLIAMASLMLLVTALPEGASATGLHSRRAAVATSDGTVTGTVTIVGAPSGFAPAFVGAGACPALTPSGVACANPIYALAENGTYSLSLPSGSWEVSGFYENNGFGGVFLSTPEPVTVPSGGMVTANFIVDYQAPATVKGTLRVTDVPTGVTVEDLSVLLCPSFAPYTGGTPSIACVTTYIEDESVSIPAAYEVSGLPPGTWTAYPSYCTDFGCATNAAAGKVLTLVAGQTTRANLRTPFLLPGEGLLAATVSVPGAPDGFSDPVGVSACQVGGGACQTTTDLGGNSLDLLLTDGQWTVNGLYFAQPFDNAIAGPTQTVTISDGGTTTLGLSVPYQVLGTVSGPIRVTGDQSHVPITSYTVVACPASVSGQYSPQCVDEYSGPGGLGVGVTILAAAKAAKSATKATGATKTKFDLYSIGTLTPGSWVLYPGYGTALGSYTDPVGTKVIIVAGQTTSQRLTVPFQTPTSGAVAGDVVVIGAPSEGGFESGVEACAAPPSGLSCADEQEAFSQANGSYTLTLSPGTWWLAGFVDLFGGSGLDQSTSAAQEVTVAPGSQLTADFTVQVATS